jgi:DMATS type aromatic prenyltransferase
MLTLRPRAWDAKTYREIIQLHLTTIVNAIDRSDLSLTNQINVVNSLFGSWTDEPVERFEDHHSFVANDGLPIEFSFALSRTDTSVRLLFEPLDVPSRAPYWSHEGYAYIERLDKLLHVDVRRYRAIRDLFERKHPPDATFSILHSAALAANCDIPLFKVYLNPAVAGAEPRYVVDEAMTRLGLGQQWATAKDHLGDSSFDSQQYEIALFALDLGDSAEARVKIYLRHTDCGPEEIERAASIADDHRPNLFTDILKRVDESYNGNWQKAPMTCLSFQESRNGASSVTLYCPLDPNVAHDADSNRHILDLLEVSGIEPTSYRAIMATISDADLTRTRRLSWFGYKNPDDPVITVYAGLRGFSESTTQHD